MPLEVPSDEEGWQDDQCSTIITQERTGTKLCKACVSIFHPSRKRNRSRKDEDVSYRHIEHLDTLRRSASRGCDLCNHLLRSLRACEPEYAPAPELDMKYNLVEQQAPVVLDMFFVYTCRSKSAAPIIHSVTVFLVGKSSFKSLLFCSIKGPWPKMRPPNSSLPALHRILTLSRPGYRTVLRIIRSAGASTMRITPRPGSCR